MVTKIRRYLERRGWLKHQPPLLIPFRHQIILSMKRPVSLDKIQTSIKLKIKLLNEGVITKMNTSIDYLLEKKRKKDASNLFVAALRAFISIDSELGINFAKSRIYQIPDTRGIKTLADILVKNKSFNEIPKLLDLVGPSPWKVRINSKLAKSGQSRPISSQANKSVIKNISSPTILFVSSQVPPTTNLKNRLISEIKIACVMDNFSFSAFKLEADFKQLSVTNYLQELQTFKPDFIFFESAWRGKDDLWGSKVGHADFEVIDILNWAKNANCPTIFWNKEDPVHFKSFLNVAKLFNYVFTTDIDCIQRYKKALQHERVYLLPFAVQPKLHNPIEEFKRIDKLCFAGAYYKKYQQRNEDMTNILSGISDKIGFDIYDRNYLDDNPDYTFPEIFHSNIIGTLDFEDINLAYKGYNLALNLNTIKNSQTMFARRVFELLASNTLVFSNFSRGIKMLFGDLVFCSDSGKEILEKYISMTQKQKQELKLLAMRKVFSEHTYRDRLEYIVNKISSNYNERKSNSVLVTSLVKDKPEALSVIENFSNQRFTSKKLILISEDKFSIEGAENIDIIFVNDLEQHFFEEFGSSYENICYFHHKCKYGSNYLTDVINGTKYSDGLPVSKIYDEINSDVIHVPFTKVDEVLASSTMFPIKSIMNKPVIPNLRRWRALEKNEMSAILLDAYEFGIDERSYSELDSKIKTGNDYNHVLSQAESITPDKENTIGHYFSSAEIYQQICDANRKNVEVEFIDGKTVITSSLNQGEFTYLYWHDFMKPKDIRVKGNKGILYFDSSPGLRMMVAVIYYDENRNKLGSDMSLANSNVELEVPKETVELRLAFRIYQQGISEVNSLDLFNHNVTPERIFTDNEVLIVSNNYPSYKEKYRNGFLHSRVVKYREENLEADVFVLKQGFGTSFREYEGTNVIEGSKQALENILQCGTHQKILVHFLEPVMWEIISKYTDSKQIIVWIHGSEIQPWHRRKFNYLSKEDEEKAKITSKPRMAFWRELFGNLPQNIRFIFVSQYFADEVMEDTGCKLDKSYYDIIHNPIDTTIFNYTEKNAEQRKKILSIRPFASMKYANDLTVKAILELSKSKHFKDMEITIVGDGKLFDETLQSLEKFSNVTINRGFLSHKEISSLHKQFGIFITPTRMDSQGVSRDEAMSSGLVPITTDITAIPEFVDSESGILTPPEDYKAMSEGILELYNNPDRFIQMSRNAAKRVRKQTDSKLIIDAELKLIKGD
jgi:glycosyltransferase involved in cell wall biosynthesis/spore maturation protein CgeB